MFLRAVNGGRRAVVDDELQKVDCAKRYAAVVGRRALGAYEPVDDRTRKTGDGRLA